MKANELRVGNYVNIMNDTVDMEYVKTIVTIRRNFVEIECNEDQDSFQYHEIQPIPITEYWLLGFGFELVEDAGDIKGYKLPGLSTFEVELNHQDIALNVCVDEYCTTVMYDEKFFAYVHQLQNLYFALRGEELMLVNKNN